MSIDIKVKVAINEAVRNYSQGPELAEEIVAWLDNLSSGNEDLNDTELVSRRLELLFSSIKL